jgi:hypothetical protein
MMDRFTEESVLDLARNFRLSRQAEPRTAASAGPPFHVECREFRASYAECCRLANNADFDRQVQEAREETKYWEKIKETK